jgi:hypothetical protein
MSNSNQHWYRLSSVVLTPDTLRLMLTHPAYRLTLRTGPDSLAKHDAIVTKLLNVKSKKFFNKLRDELVCCIFRDYLANCTALKLPDDVLGTCTSLGDTLSEDVYSESTKFETRLYKLWGALSDIAEYTEHIDSSHIRRYAFPEHPLQLATLIGDSPHYTSCLRSGIPYAEGVDFSDLSHPIWEDYLTRSISRNDQTVVVGCQHDGEEERKAFANGSIEYWGFGTQLYEGGQGFKARVRVHNIVCKDTGVKFHCVDKLYGDRTQEYAILDAIVNYYDKSGDPVVVDKAVWTNLSACTISEAPMIVGTCVDCYSDTTWASPKEHVCYEHLRYTWVKEVQRAEPTIVLTLAYDYDKTARYLLCIRNTEKYDYSVSCWVPSKYTNS